MVDAVLNAMGLKAAQLPAVNAVLNSIAAVFLLVGWWAVRTRRITIHKAAMITAFSFSTLFLASYVYCLIVVKRGRSTEFTALGWPRYVYFTVLVSHVVLAMVIAVAAPILLVLGLRNRIDRHRRLARWTLPIWLYVSVTGVVVYVMVYRLFPPAG